MDFIISRFQTLPTALPVIGIVVLVLLIAYRWALPKPIPTIPYNVSATRSLLGDIPEIMAYMTKTGQTLPWIADQVVKHNSPIIQVFARPFTKPWVVVTDFKESQDILLRRTKEFDRSKLFANVLVGLIPESHAVKQSNDAQFKSNRNLVNHLMTPIFLNQVVAPQIYSSVEAIIHFWTLKSKIANGRPFEASTDIFHAALDLIMSSIIGMDKENTTVAQRYNFLSAQKDLHIPTDINEPVLFPEGSIPARSSSLLILTDSLEISSKAPTPRLAHTILRQFPYMRKAISIKEDMLNEEIAKAVKKFSEGDAEPRTAVEDIIYRERLAAKKEDRPPAYFQRKIIDEIFGFLIAGHDTSSSVVAAVVKRLADNPQVQTSLRSALRDAYPAATASKCNPTVDEISKIPIPYLDAVIEETLRLSSVSQGPVRRTLADTMILGHHVPKGTDVLLMNVGPSFFTDPFDIKDEIRSPSAVAAQSNEKQVGSWNPTDAETFQPERWLATKNGEQVYDALAGPILMFGGGPRGCFGKRMAYLELRIIVCLLAWNFVFEKCPKELSSYGLLEKLTGHPKQCYVRLSEVVW